MLDTMPKTLARQRCQLGIGHIKLNGSVNYIGVKIMYGRGMKKSGSTKKMNTMKKKKKPAKKKSTKRAGY